MSRDPDRWPKGHATRQPEPAIASARIAPAQVFAALGDETRLRLLATLAAGKRTPIARLTEGSGLSRQAVTKHLRVLEKSRLVRCVRAGRESLYELDPEPLGAVRDYLEGVSRQWDDALSRLKAFVEVAAVDGNT